MPKTTLTRLRLLDYSDRELLQIVHEIAEASPAGFATSLDIANRLGIEGDRRTNSVGSRLAALRRAGVVEREVAQGKSIWRLAPMGHIMVFGKPSKAQEQAINSAKPEDMLLMTRALARKQHRAPDAARFLVRREWVRSTTVNGNGKG